MQRRKYALLKQPFELDALGDVSLTNPVLGDVMYYDGSFWINTPYAELVDDRVANLLVAGNNIDLTYNDTLGTITIDVETLTSADISDFNEAVDDRVGSLIVAGNNIDVTYNDGANTFTIDVEGLTSVDISDFTEAAQDAVGAMVSASGVGVDLVYTDATPALVADLDINGLTAETSVDSAADYFVMYDASAGTHKKVLGSNMPGGGGGSVATDTIWDAKGDLAVGTGANTASRLAVGTDGYVLTADSAAATGLKWAAAGGSSALTGCRAIRTTNQSITTGAGQAVSFDSEDFDDAAYHDNSTNPTRLTIPTGGDGNYIITGALRWDANTSGTRTIFIQKNGTTILSIIKHGPVAETRQSITTIANLAAGDYVELYAQQDSGSTRTVTAETGVPHFAIHRLA